MRRLVLLAILVGNVDSVAGGVVFHEGTKKYHSQIDDKVSENGYETLDEAKQHFRNQAPIDIPGLDLRSISWRKPDIDPAAPLSEDEEETGDVTASEDTAPPAETEEDDEEEPLVVTDPVVVPEAAEPEVAEAVVVADEATASDASAPVEEEQPAPVAVEPTETGDEKTPAPELAESAKA